MRRSRSPTRSLTSIVLSSTSAQGASTLTIPPPPPDGSNEAMALRYQGNFVRAARECAVVGGQMVMKVGVQGRIIVGPAGGPGQVDVPLRIAVVEAPRRHRK